MPGYVRVYQLFSGRGSQAHKSKWYYDIKKNGGYKWCPEMPHKFKNELETMCFFHVFSKDCQRVFVIFFFNRSLLKRIRWTPIGLPLCGGPASV